MQLARLTFCLAALAFSLDALAMDCPSAPPAMRDIKAQGYYTDAAHSVIDEAKKRANTEMTRPLDDYTKQVADMSDRYLAKHDVSAGQCTIEWLSSWARDGAMLGEMIHINNDQSDYLRQWVAGGAGIAYLKTRELATAGQRAEIDAWLEKLATANMAYWDNPKKTRNNHYYWTGVGVMAAAVATGDPALLDTARGVYEKGINDIEDDGSLPMEMKRGKRALHYHNYALAPLVLMAEMARLKGEDWYAYKDHRINRLAELVASGYRDDSWFAAQSGVKQEKWKPDGEAGWVEFYRLRAVHPELFEPLHDAGPFREPRMGGNLTLMAQVGITGSK
ncbi:mannuronate-specific alginate lyase [Paraburkholderia saeva]|uniref:Polysaccharide lyase n=1 Tax=Paraburkholderia saeva TaxID=2777537 RepID=A0A9N8RTA2_9BURK|nr:mannuronate-specific alginate lyase [Paraburkholderia saeva]CAG4887956.1 Polysaccharide lyase [Paraburkholderia saeva]CAG4901605.1 Polysaccharide lyase [Paraburkholderia saeva]